MASIELEEYTVADSGDMAVVTVVIPVYNTERFLNTCIESAVNQTYKNLDIVLIDDGSTDGSLSICEQHAMKDSRIRVYHKDNEGLGLTRNFGIRVARGSYITFLDSDDYLFQDAIEVMINAVREYDVDIVCAGMVYREAVMGNSVECGLYSHDAIMSTILVRMMGSSLDCGDAFIYASTAKLYKLSAIRDCSAEFPSERELIWEDLVFTTKLFPNCDSICILDSPVYYYRYNDDSLTHKYVKEKHKKIIKLYEYMELQIKKLNLPDEAMVRLANNFYGHIIACLKQEVLYAERNGFNYSIKQVSAICSCDEVHEMLAYLPLNRLGLQRRVLGALILNRNYLAVYLLCRLQNMRKRVE